MPDAAPLAPGPAAPSPTAAAPPGAPPPAAGEAPKARETRTPKTYTTGARVRGAPPAAATASPTTPAAAPTAPAALPPKETPPSAPQSTPDPSLPSPQAGADGTPSGADSGAEPPPAEGAAALSESEAAKRLAKITRAEGRLVERERAHAQRLAVADAVAQTLGPAATPQGVAHALRQVQLVANGKAAALQDPVGFLARVFGVDPQHTIQRAIDGAVGHAAKPAGAQTQEALEELRARQAAYEKALQGEQAARQQESAARQVEDYQRGTLAPMLSDKAKFKHLHAFCALNGADPVRQVYDAMVEQFRATGAAPEAKAFAERIETALQSRFSQHGASVSPGLLAAPARVETPKAPAPVSRRSSTASAPAASEPGAARPFARQRVGQKPYTSKPM